MHDEDTRDPAPAASRGWQYGVAALAVAFLVLHLPYLPASLEDLDSINFALALRRFDVAHHQPHPPGYPIYVALAKMAHTLVPAEAKALSVVGVVAGALSAFALSALFARIVPTPRRLSALATLLTITAPLYWFTPVRPLSDTTGLAVALCVQAFAVSSKPDSTLLSMFSGFLGGLAAGVRSQVAWLTLPLLLLQVARRSGNRTREAMKVGAAFVLGVLVWLIPLVALSGGVGAYARALFNQGSEDLSGVRMLWTTPTARQLLLSLKTAFVDPWAVPAVAVIVIVSALIGSFHLLRRRRPAFMTLAFAFGPYLIFDLLFQETATGRYALPLVVPMAFLAVRGLEVAGPAPAVVVAVGLAAFNAHVGGTSVAAYAREKAPAFRMLDDMARAARDPLGPPTLAMDRRQDLDLRRPILWVGGHMPEVASRLPAPPNHEWLEVVKHWNDSGGLDAPVWYVADPLRTDVDLLQHSEPAEYLWRLPYPLLVGGARPNELRWYRIARPDWYVGEGWALTPEAAGVAEADHQGPAIGAIRAWVEPSALQGAMIIGGRNLAGGDAPARVTVSVDGEGRTIMDTMVLPGAFLLEQRFDQESVSDRPAARYAMVSVRATSGSRVAVEQWDVSAVRPVAGFGRGWHEQEYNPATGLRWRWLSERGELRFRAPQPRAGVPALSAARREFVLHLEGESPLRYFSRASHITIRSGDRILHDRVIDGDFSFDQRIPAELLDGAFHTLTLETDQTYVPAERSRRTQDRRRLGLRVFTCEVKPESPAS